MTDDELDRQLATALAALEPRLEPCTGILGPPAPAPSHCEAMRRAGYAIPGTRDPFGADVLSITRDEVERLVEDCGGDEAQAFARIATAATKQLKSIRLVARGIGDGRRRIARRVNERPAADERDADRRAARTSLRVHHFNDRIRHDMATRDARTGVVVDAFGNPTLYPRTKWELRAELARLDRHGNLKETDEP